jgi:hypothetical protein
VAWDNDFTRDRDRFYPWEWFMSRKRPPADDARFAIEQQLEDWQRGLVDVYITGGAPCPVCNSRLRHLCSDCERDLDGKIAYRMLQAKERVKDLAARLRDDPKGYVEAVFAEALVDDAVSMVHGRASEACQQLPLQWQLLLAVLARQPETESPRELASWLKFGVVDLSIGVPGGSRVTVPGSHFEGAVQTCC